MVYAPSIPEAEAENEVELWGLVPAELRSQLAWSSSYPPPSALMSPEQDQPRHQLRTHAPHGEAQRPGLGSGLPSVSSSGEPSTLDTGGWQGLRVGPPRCFGHFPFTRSRREDSHPGVLGKAELGTAHIEQT